MDISGLRCLFSSLMPLLQKRNAIVWHVAKSLANKQHQHVVGTVGWRYDYADERKPVLVLQPPRPNSADKSTKRNKKHPKAKRSNEKSAKWRIMLHFGIDESAIPALRLVPNRCNLGGTNIKTSQMYNQALLEDLVSSESSHRDSLQSIVHADAYLHLQDALILCQIWCLQRGLLRRHDGWTTESLAYTLVYLYRSKAASPRMSPLQVAQAFWKLLAETNWLGEAVATVRENSLVQIRKAPSQAYVDIRDSPRNRAVLVMPIQDGTSLSESLSQSEVARIYAQQTKESPVTETDPPTLLKLYEQSYTLGPVLLDSSLRYNILGRISPSVIRQAQRDARHSLQRVHQAHRPFASLFMKDARFWKRYDAYIRIPYDQFDFEKSAMWGDDRFDVGDAEAIHRGVRHVLGKALTDRVREIQILSTGNGSIGEINTENAWQDSDQIPTQSVRGKKSQSVNGIVSPTGSKDVVIGIALDPDTCFRVVDRGPPADDDAATSAFSELWGEKAELRRFKDGAIVHAAVWNDDFSTEGNYVHYLNDDKMQGGIVERIIRYILGLHFVNEEAASLVQFSLRDIQSCIDGVQPASDNEVTFNPLVAHRLVMRAFDTLADFLRESSRPTIPIPGTSEQKSRLGIPLAIETVEPLSPCLRYTELFPPVPHPLLGGSLLPGIHRISQIVPSQPILVQIRFSGSSKWPNDLTAIKAAKAAMLIQLLNGIDSLKKANDPVAVDFGEHSVICTDSVDVSFRGYVFRVIVRADPELRLLRSLIHPSEEAASLLNYLTLRHLVAAKHHSVVHAVFTRHASASAVVRLAQRWLASHMLSNHFSIETIELLVAYVYSSPSSPVDAPASVTAGFIHFLELLATLDWKHEPLIVDPQMAFSMDDLSVITKDFEFARGQTGDQGPPLFIISPSAHPTLDEQVNVDKATGPSSQPTKASLSNSWTPVFSLKKPEWVVVNRAAILASKSYDILMHQLKNFDNTEAKWPIVFTEPSASFGNYSVLMRVDHEFIMDSETSSSGGKSLIVGENKAGALQSSYTRSMIERYKGPKSLQRKLFKNLLIQEDIVLEWRPVDAMLACLEKELDHVGLFFYNHLCPEVVAILWRPGIFKAKPFSAIQSEWVRPVVDRDWTSGTLVTVSTSDLLVLASKYTRDIVTTVKVLDKGMTSDPSSPRKRSIDEARSKNENDSEDEE